MKPLKLGTVDLFACAEPYADIGLQNIVLTFLVKGIFIVFGAMGLASMWEAVFADMLTALLAVANATRIIRGKQHDRIEPHAAQPART